MGQALFNTEYTTDYLIGMNVKEAGDFIKSNNVYYGNNDNPITEICLIRSNGKSIPRYKDIRRRKGRMRLNVETMNDIITKITTVG